ncbi:hypothetical protein LCGC14_1573540 [marine sediment metagenome]|uniref:Uncharacterized protein n=1 Tax=marine sediment metagenome TaxID=412755 RepID=A0A0F9LJE6_9ZZZZ
MKLYAIYKDTSDFDRSEEAIAFFTQKKDANHAMLSLTETESNCSLYSIKTINVNEHVKFLRTKKHKFGIRAYINSGKISISNVYPTNFTTELTFTHETNKQGNSSVTLTFASLSIGRARMQALEVIENFSRKAGLLSSSEPKLT